MLLANSWQMTDLGSRNTRVSFKLYLYLLYFRETDISTGRTREFKEWEIAERKSRDECDTSESENFKKK